VNIRIAPIGDFVEPVRTWNPASKPDATFSYVDLSAVDQNEKQIKAAVLVRGLEAPSRARQLISKGDILVSTVRPNLNGVAAVTDKFEGATTSTGFCVLRPCSEKLSSNYLMHWVRSPQFVEHMVREATGASYPAVSDRIVKASRIPLPPINEQRRIAAILDKADALRRNRKRAFDLLDSLTQSVFRGFYDPISKHTRWPTKALGELCDLVRGSSPRPQGDARFFGGPIPRLMIADITRDGKYVAPTIDSLTEKGAKKSRPMSKGSVVMAVSGAVGLPAILAVDACIHDGFVGFRNLEPSILPAFLYHVLLENRSENRAQGTGAIWSNLTTDQVKQFQIPILPINLQQELIDRLANVERSVKLFRGSAELVGSLFSSLQHRAFCGRL
jgi:type I restriction enzyme, S subunit